MSVAVAPEVPALIRLGRLSDDEQRQVDGLLEQLRDKQRHNRLVERYYEGKQRIRDMGIAIPPHLRSIETVVGWPGTVVDVLEERLDIDGWTIPGAADDAGIGEIVEANRLHTEYSEGHLDALIYGIAFVTVGSGAAGEPNPLVTVESPLWMTAAWNRRRRAVDAALSVAWSDNPFPGSVSGATLYLPGLTIRAETNGIGQWRVVDRDEHDLPVVPVAQLVNRPRRGDQGGRSEITRAVRSYTDNAVRTVLGMEVSREFFAAPMLWVLGASESAFVDKDGNPKSAWETYIGRLKAIEASQEGTLPDVKQFSGSSPAPFLEQLRGMARMLAAEAAIPESYLGVHTDNPSSADAIRAGEARLIKRAERRHRTFGSPWSEAKRLALWIRDGREPTVTPRPIWRDPATPTRAAAADETTKLVGAGILPADSDVTLERVGLSETDRIRVAADRRRARAERTLSALAAAAQAAREDAEVAELDALR